MDKYFDNLGICDNHLYAIFYVYDGFSLELCKLYDDEHDLNANRFSNFSLEILPSMTEIVLDAPKGRIQDWISSLLEWVSINIRYKWHFELTGVPLSKFKLIWCFEDKNDAMLFKLSHY